MNAATWISGMISDQESRAAANVAAGKCPDGCCGGEHESIKTPTPTTNGSGGGYENAPATKLLATHCACCGRPLVDATSVETGVGPDCREKHGYAEAQGSPNWDLAMKLLDGWVPVSRINSSLSPREACNKLVHDIACDRDEDMMRLSAGPLRVRILAIHALGYVVLARCLAQRTHEAVTIRYEQANDGSWGVSQWIVIQAPYSEGFNVAVRSVPGVRSFKIGKTFYRRVPVSSKPQLWAAIKKIWTGGILITEDKMVTIGGAS